jgi:hypothetical protein
MGPAAESFPAVLRSAAKTKSDPITTLNVRLASVMIAKRCGNMGVSLITSGRYS